MGTRAITLCCTECGQEYAEEHPGEGCFLGPECRQSYIYTSPSNIHEEGKGEAIDNSGL